MKKQLLKKLVGAVAFAGFSASASAATYDLGFLEAGIVAHPFTGNVAIGTFNDVYKFELPANGKTGYSVIDFPTTVTIPNVGTFSFKTIFSSLVLVSDPDGIPFTSDDNTVLTKTQANASKIEMTWPASPGGKMYLIVNGAGQGGGNFVGGIYGGAISVAPVPEPETWAMMLIGAGLVGFRLHKRSKKAAASRLV